MLTELGCAFILSKSLQYLFSSERILKDKWKETLLKCKIEGIRNKDNQTFTIGKLYKKDYGYFAIVNIPTGLSVNALENAKKVLEDNLNCLIEIEKERFESYIKVKVVNKIINHAYLPVKVNPYELYLGKKLDNSNYLISLKTNPHIILSGMTGCGKSFLFSMILCNQIYNCKKDIEIYLFQVLKGEIDIFKDCPSVKFCSTRIDEITVMLEKLVQLINKRSKQFASMGIKNIDQWNKVYKSKKMKRIIVGVEEISGFMQEGNPCFDHFITIVKTARSVGIHLIALTQRTTVANLGGDGELKAQTCVISSKQRSVQDSINAVGVGDCAYLKEHEFISSENSGWIRFKVPEIDENFEVLNKYVPEIKVPQIKEIKHISNELTYEESQKLKTHSEFYIINKDTVKDSVPPPDKIEEPPKTPKVRKNKKGVKPC